MELETLAGKVRNGTATEADRLQLYSQAQPFCRKLARQYASLLRCSGEEEDLLQEAFLAIMDAARTYSPEHGTAFLTWAAFYLRRAFESYIGRQSGGSAATVRRLHLVRKYEAEFTAIHGRGPSESEICLHFEITPETLQILRQRGKEGSLNATIDEEGTLEELDRLADPRDMEADIIDRITAGEVRAILRRYISELPADERRATYLFYFLNRTDKQGAADMYITLEQFRGLRAKALRKLKTAKHLRELGRYLPEQVGSAAYYQINTNRSKWQSSTELAAFLSIDKQDEAEQRARQYEEGKGENMKIKFSDEYEQRQTLYQLKKNAAKACGLPEAAADYIKGETRPEILKDAVSFARTIEAHQSRANLNAEVLRVLTRDLAPERAEKWDKLWKEEAKEHAYKSLLDSLKG